MSSNSEEREDVPFVNFDDRASMHRHPVSGDVTSEHINTVQQYTKTQVNSWSNVIILISPGDQRVPALHQHLVLRDLPQADPLHRSDNPHRPSCQGACRGLIIL